MTDRNALDQAHRDMEEAQSRLRELGKTREDAGGFADADAYAARKDELDGELAKARDEVRIQEQLESTRGVEDIDMSVSNEGTFEREGQAGTRPGPTPGDDQAGLDKLENDRLMAIEHEEVDRSARGDASWPAPPEASDGLASFEPQSASQPFDEPIDPSAHSGTGLSPLEEILKQDEDGGFPAFATGGVGEFAPDGPSASETVPVTYAPPQAPPRKLQVALESPRIPDGGYVKARVETTEAERELHRENIDKWRDGSTIGETPERQAHAPHGRQAHAPHGRQAHSPHGATLPKKALLVVGVGLLIAVIGGSAVALGPGNAPAPAASPIASVPIVAAPPTSTATSATTRAAATYPPVGATIVVTPYLRWTGNCNGDKRLEPKTISNPPVGSSAAYEWQVEFPSCASSRSWGLDYVRPFGPAQTFFLPKTTWTMSPLERGACGAGACRLLMVVTVRNEGN